MSVLGEAEVVRTALSPVRRTLLERLRRDAASATQLADELGLSRQRVNYHLHLLEAAGLVELVEQRARRGFTERVLRATASSFMVDPDVLAEEPALPDPEALDRFAAEHLVRTAAGVVSDVTRLRATAEQRGRRLLTFTIEADLRLGAPADLERLTTALADALATTTASFDTPGGRHYRVVVGGHPAPRTPTKETT